MNYFLTFIYYSAWIVSILGFGTSIANIFKNLKINFGLEKELLITVYGFLGFIFIYLTIAIINFFIPVNSLFSHLFLISGILLFLLNRKELIYLFKGNLPIISFLYIFNAFIPFRWLLYYDTGLYHLQMIKWITQSKVPLGLSNLYYAFGTNSSWFNISAVVEQPAVLLKAPFFISNSIFLFFYGIGISFAFKEFIKNKITLSNIFLALTSIPWLINSISSWSSSTCYDLPVNFLIPFSIFLTIKYFEDAAEINKNNILLIIILPIFAITIKISSAPLILLPLLIIIFKFITREINFNKNISTTCIISSSLILIPWILKSVFISGYLIFPFTFTRLNLKWASPLFIANSSLENISQIAKMGSVANELLDDFKWVNSWFIRFITQNKIVVILIFLCAISFIVMLLKKNNKKINYLSLAIPFIVAALGIIYWFLSAPDFRFGQGYIFSFVFILMSCAIFKMNFMAKNTKKLTDANITKKKNIFKFTLLFLGLFIIFCSLIFLFYKDFQSLLLNLLSLIRKKEIAALGLIKLKFLAYMLLLIGLIIIFSGIHYFKNKKIILITSIVIEIFFSLVVTQSFLFYQREYRTYPTSNIFPKITLIKTETLNGDTIYVPEKGDQTWDAPLPSAPTLNKNLQISYSKNGLPRMFWFKQN